MNSRPCSLTKTKNEPGSGSSEAIKRRSTSPARTR